MLRRNILLWSLLLSIPSWPAAAQNIPARERGLLASAPYDYGQIDNVNLFNGNLTLTLPIGQEYKVDGLLSYALGLHYNSNVWEFAYKNGVQIESTTMGGSFQGRTNAGTGWRLTLGRMLPPSSLPLNPSSEWMLIHPHGARSRFYPTLHDGDPSSAHRYTRDGTYLRLVDDDGFVYPYTFDVEFPSGISHRYHQVTGDLLRIEDPWGNYLDVTYPQSGTQQLTDKHGRTHYVYFRSSSPGKDMIDRVDLQTFGGARAVYTFNYQDVVSARYGDTYHPPGSTVTLKLLTSINLPDGSSFQMSYFTQEVQPHAGNGWTVEVPGMISALTLPTRGRYEWRYANYDFDNTYFAPRGGDNEGVVSRKMLNENGVLLGEWTYDQTYTGSIDESTTTVRSPLGDETVHYFVNEDSLWQHGLPFTMTANDGGTPPRYLSSKIYDGTAASGTLQRTQYVRYTADSNLSPLPNARVERSKTVYNSDSNRQTTVTLSKFDGLGHYRTSATSSNFPDTNNRENFTDYNPAQGRYEYDAHGGFFTSSHNYTPVSDNQPWILSTFTQQTATEGGVTTKSTFCFDAQKGSMKRRRLLKGSAESSQDLVAQYTHSGAGNLTREEYLGGDKETHSLSTNCTPYSSSWSQYRIDHTYQYGTLKTSEFKTAAGASMSFKSMDLDLDLSTGLPTTSRDTAGLATTYSFDNLGRLTQAMPPAQVPTTHTYYPAGTFSPPQIKHLTGADVESWNQFDAFGRPWKEVVARENGQYSAREILYNGNGWQASKSEWMNDGGAITSKTEYLNYDPIGRPGIVRPPDGSQHDVTLAYSGDYQIQRSLRVGTGRSGSAIVYTTATTTERYNGHGQLARVIEPNGTETRYTYNVHGQLAKVEMDINGTPQAREFNYDLRGLLTSEKHPEKGMSGNGFAYFYDYDARGRVGRLNDGAHDLTLTYDRAERLLQIRETSGQQRVLKELEYATANSGADYRQGRVWKATRHNHLEPRLPGVTLSVTETYAYGSQGKPTARTTTVSSGESFTLGLAFDNLGNLQTLTYPACAHASCTDDNPVPSRNLTHNYTRGYLTGIPGFANLISYHTNLTLNQVAHANGQVVTHQLDPSHIRRPYRIDFNAAGTQGVGPFAYDGAGNVAKIGAEDYLYDTLSRVTQATMTGGVWQSYSYDKFGNITQITTNGTPQPINVVPATNRISGFQYDGAGNQLHYIQGTANLNLAYDAFNMINNVQGGTADLIHVYTANDERILSFPASGTTSKWTLRGLGNEILRVYNENETGGTPVWSHDTDYMYLGSKLLASHSAANGTRYFHLDHLGTPRLIKDNAGQVLASHDYYPFGEELAPGTDQERKKFTGHERDSNGTGVDDDLDYMHARYFAPELGRFLQPDPAYSSRPELPQSWNRYAYVLNGPLVYIDPDGRVYKKSPGPPWDEDGWFAPWEVLTLFDIVRSRELLEEWRNDGGPLATFLAGAGLDLLDLFGLDSPDDLIVEIAMAGIPPIRLVRSVAKACKLLGIDELVAKKIIHAIKEVEGLRGDENLLIDVDTGDLYHPHTGEHLGNLNDDIH